MADRFYILMDDDVACEVAKVCDENIDDDMLGQCDADARRIAAAPELLAVCQAIANDLSLFQFTDGEYRLSEQSANVILQSLRDVIAKAEGRTDDQG